MKENDEYHVYAGFVLGLHVANSILRGEIGYRYDELIETLGEYSQGNSLNAPSADVAAKFHLPPTILRLCIALREDQIMGVGVVNLRDAPVIPNDFDFIGEARNADGLSADGCVFRLNDDLTVLLRERATCPTVKDDDTADYCENE